MPRGEEEDEGILRSHLLLTAVVSFESAMILDVVSKVHSDSAGFLQPPSERWKSNRKKCGSSSDYFRPAKAKRPQPHRRKWLLPKSAYFVIIPTALAVLVYSNSLNGDFVHDDIVAIVRNPDVTGIASSGNVFFNDFWGSPMSSNLSHKSYRPITTLLFR